MPDWKREIESRLDQSGTDPASQYDLVQELAQHLEDRYQDLIAGGSAESAARASVLAELHDMQQVRRAHTRPSALPPGAPPGSVLSDLARDVRYGWRVIRKTPILTFFAIASLSLGIGANSTVFTIINTLLLHPLPVREPSRLVTVYETDVSQRGRNHLPVSYANFEDYADQQRCFQGMAAFTPPLVLTIQRSAGSERVFGEFVTAQYFTSLGLSPAAGRFFLEEEDRHPGAAPVAILSYNAWQSRFGGSQEAIGRKVTLNRTVFTVVGVAPPGFLGISATFGPDLWLPATMAETASPMEFANALSDRAKPLFHTIGRLKSGFNLKSAQAQLETVSSNLRRQYPDSNEERAIAVRPITDELFSSSGGSNGVVFGSAVLLVIVALILGIACSNVANLLLARATARRQEIAVRLAIGANRGRIIRQMLAESLLLSVLSCAVGLAIGFAGCQFVWSFVPGDVVGNMVTPRLDGNVVAFSLALALITAFLFGLAPAMRASRPDVITALKEETRTAGRVKGSLAGLLLVGQVAFSLVCLVTAALFFRSVQRAYKIDPGFDTRHLTIFMLNPAQAGYGEARVKEFYRAVRDQVSTLPGVSSVSWAAGPPFWHSAAHSVVIEGAEQRRKTAQFSSVVITVDTGYFRTMAIPLQKGRTFDDRDREETVPVAVINDALAREHWPTGDALGHRLQFAGEKTWRQVIGVVKNANYTTLGESPQPCVYTPLRQNFSEGMALYVKAEGDPSGLLSAVQREVRNLDSNIDINDVRTGQKLLDQVLWTPKVGVALLGVFGSLALVLASVGLYGVMAYAVSQRRREIGVRSALGASRVTVINLILGDGLRLVCYGVAAGLGAALLVGRALSRMLFGISSADPLSYAAASLTLIVVALIACYLPARAATRIDPMIALRDS